MPFEASTQQQAKDTLIILRDTSSGAEAEIFAFGAILNAFRIPVNNTMINIIDGFSSVSDARETMTAGFKSAKLSPFVCRMRKGDYGFLGKRYHVNGHYLGEHVIHGLLFDHTYQVTDVTKGEDHASATLEYDYMGTDEGYPFPYHIQITWKLETGNRLSVSSVITHQNDHPIPYADGWHPYFTLGGSVDEWTMQFDGHQQLEYDSDLLPTGKKFKDTRFAEGCLLKDIELDNSFELDGKAPRCVLQNGSLKLIIEPDESYPLLQVYIPPHRKSIAIENLSGAPDNFNNGIHLLLLTPGNAHTFTTGYRIETV